MRDYLSQCKDDLKGRTKRNISNPRSGEVWWVENCDGIKDRPVIVIRCEKDNVICLKCTSQSGNRRMIEDYLEAGLNTETYVEPVQQMIRRSSLKRRLGTLSENDKDSLRII